MLKIRLQRVGRKKAPKYRIVVSEHTRDTQADHLEQVGTYDPHDKENGLVLKEDRIKHWLGNGAKASETVFNLLLKTGLVKGDKKKSVSLSDKRKAKLEEKNKEKTEKAKAKAEESKPEAEKVEEVVGEVKPQDTTESVKEEIKPEEKPAEPVEEKKEETKPETTSPAEEDKPAE